MNQPNRTKNSYTANLINNKRALVISRQSLDTSNNNLTVKLN